MYVVEDLGSFSISWIKSLNLFLLSKSIGLVSNFLEPTSDLGTEYRNLADKPRPVNVPLLTTLSSTFGCTVRSIVNLGFFT